MVIRVERGFFVDHAHVTASVANALVGVSVTITLRCATVQEKLPTPSVLRVLIHFAAVQIQQPQVREKETPGPHQPCSNA